MEKRETRPLCFAEAPVEGRENPVLVEDQVSEGQEQVEKWGGKLT